LKSAGYDITREEREKDEQKSHDALMLFNAVKLD
jgi:hypothetical protein